MTRARRVDGNQALIVEALRKAGYQVYLTFRIGCGFPDLLCVSKTHIAVLLEVKMPGEKLTADEKIFHDEYEGYLDIIYSTEDAITVMQAYDRAGIIW